MNVLTAIILYLLGAIVFGYAARRVSEYRGESDGFWWGFWLNWLGLLIVIFRRSAGQEISTAPPGSLRQSWLCSKCGARNPAGREQCQSCLAQRHVASPMHHCPSCGAKNKATNSQCFACGHSFEN